MNVLERIRKTFVYVVAAACVPMVAAVITGVGSTKAAGPAQAADQDVELQLGQQIFDELKAKGEIVESSPLYDQLRPISDAITRAAQPQYNHPFNFYLVHETQPNAFAPARGNVYVGDSLLYFVNNPDELGGTLCPEGPIPSITTR